jgi:hypothetical protein
MIARSTLSLCLACCFSLSAYAQTGGVVTGTVRDETGGALPAVSINFRSNGTELTTSTDGTGTYRLDNVPPGPATLTFKMINFGVIRRDLSVAAGQAMTVNAVLGLSLSADVVVTGSRTFRNVADLEDPAENLVGVASAASQGAITARQLEGRPLMRPAEVLESVPGMIASQHSGEGKANQYYLRGFNLDHGTDFATTIAGVPVNTPTGAHSHGYTDTNSLIPELISGVQFRKGPYYAEDGDFAAAGSANINYVNQLDRPIASASGGGKGWGRLFAAASPRIGGGHLLAGLEVATNNGPWELPDDLRKLNGILRYSRGDTRNGLSVTGLGYSAEWNSTDQVPVRAIHSGSISRFGNIDPTDGGKTSRYTVVVDGQRASSNASTRVTAFAQHYALNVFSNFTYFLDDPANGDQFEQADRRWVLGSRATHRRLNNVFGRPVESAVGLQLRHDAMSQIGLFRTIARRRVPLHTHAGGFGHAAREDVVGETSGGLFGQADVEWSPTFRTILGLRGDVFRFDVASNNALNSGSGIDGLVSPKLTVVLGPWQGTEFYINGGYGYHSNDARGATITVDPKTGEPADRVDLLTRAKGAELGVRTVRLKGLQSTVALWVLGFDSELLFIGDAGATEPRRPSRRFGIEWTNYIRLNPWVMAEGDLSFSRARFTNESSTGNFVPGTLDRVISGAMTVEPTRRLFGSIRLRHFGPRPLLEDASVMSASTTIWNGEIGVALSQHARLSIEGFNLLDSAVADIDYFYRSRLPGEPAGGLEDIHTHPAIPRTARVMLQVSF